MIRASGSVKVRCALGLGTALLTAGSTLAAFACSSSFWASACSAAFSAASRRASSSSAYFGSRILSNRSPRRFSSSGTSSSRPSGSKHSSSAASCAPPRPASVRSPPPAANIKAACDYLAAYPRVRLLGEIKAVGPGSPVAGTRWTYLMTPWGLQMELVDRAGVVDLPEFVTLTGDPNRDR